MSEINRIDQPTELNESQLEQAAGGRMRDDPNYSMPSTGGKCCYQPTEP